jgi:hypothetical protein
MQTNLDDLTTDATVPLSAIPFDLGQFRHGAA